MRGRRSTVFWADHNTQYSEDLVTCMKDNGCDVQGIQTCRDLLRMTKRIFQSSRESRVLIAELCLPLGEHDGVGIDVPVEFHSADQNIQRGLWLSQHLLQQKKKFHSTVPIIILSGNLDCDTIAMLETIGIPQSDRWKKPAEFDAFMKTILGLTAQK